MSSIVNKIRKLLALAEGSEGNEAEVAARLAEELMAEHAITLSHLDEAEMLEADPVGVHKFEVGLNSQWRMQLAWSIASYCNVSAIRVTSWCPHYDKRIVSAVGYGHRSDLEIWEYLYKVAAREIGRRTKRHRTVAPTDIYTGTVDRGYMNRYRLGLVKGLRHRLHQDKAAKEGTRTTVEALVLQSRADRAADAMNGANPNCGMHKSSVVGNLRGQHEGRKINISPALSAKPSNHKRLKGE